MYPTTRMISPFTRLGMNATMLVRMRVSDWTTTLVSMGDGVSFLA